jgi:hypothetical protein
MTDMGVFITNSIYLNDEVGLVGAITSAHLPGSGFNRQELTQLSSVKSSYGTWPESQLTISKPQTGRKLLEEA